MLFRRIRLTKKVENSPEMKEARQIDYTEDGKAQIMVGVRSVDDIFSPYSYKTYELLNPAVVDYIDMCEATIPENEDLSIDFYTEETATNFEKKLIRRAVKRQNAERIVSINKKLKRNLAIGLSFCFLGLIVMILSALFYTQLQKIYIQEILAIVGWLFLWDGLEYILEDRIELVRKKARSMRLLAAKVHVRQYDRKIQREYGFGEFEEDDEE